MDIEKISSHYFDHQTHVKNLQNAPLQDRLKALITLASYATGIIPIGIFCAGKSASLVGKVWAKIQPSKIDLRIKDVIDTNTDIVIVGGGPVGLWTAIQMKARTNKNITIIEKYHEYQRADIRLNISASSLGGIPDDAGLKELVKEWGDRTVPIKTMEDALAKRAHELGIKILTGQAADPNLLPGQFPAAKLFVGADGARSAVRQHISGDEYKFNTIQQHCVQVQYIINPNEPEIIDRSIQKMTAYSESYRTQKFAGHLIKETITPQPDGTSKVTLQIFVDQSTFEGMKDASFKNPYYFEKDLHKLPAQLRETLIKWWGTREELADQQITQSAGQKNKITVIALGSYAAKNIVKCDDKGKIWALVGDAAAAFPFFRAINNGFLLGTELARCTEQAFKAKQTDTNGLDASFFNKYSYYATYRVYVERIRAMTKNIFISMAKLAVTFSNAVPWQVTKYTPQQKDKFYARGVDIWKRLTGSTPPPRIREKTLLNTMKMTKAA